MTTFERRGSAINQFSERHGINPLDYLSGERRGGFRLNGLRQDYIRELVSAFTRDIDAITHTVVASLYPEVKDDLDARDELAYEVMPYAAAGIKFGHYLVRGAMIEETLGSSNG